MRKKAISLFVGVLCILIAYSMFTVTASAITRNDAVNWVKQQANNKKAFDVDGINGYQCSDFASAYINYIIYGDPYYWKNNNHKGFTTYNGCNYFYQSYPSGWQKITNTADFIPQAGDILCFAAGSKNSAGHVAVAIEGCTVSYMKAVDQDGYRQGPAQFSTLNYFTDYYNFQGVIRPKFDNTTIDKTKPTINNLRVTSANESSFNISADLDDNVAVKSVWLNVYGPSGHKGYSVSASKGAFNHPIKYSDYGGYGSYSVHAYVSDTSDNQDVQGLNNFYPSSNYADGTHAVILNKTIWKPIEVCDDSLVRLGTEDGTAKHVWRFNREGDGTYKITSAQNGKVLGVENASTEDGARLITSDDVGGNNQRWVLLEKNGGYVLHPRNTTKVLDLANGNTTDGTQLQIYGSNGTDAQIFVVYGANDVQLTAPIMTVNAGTSSKKTLFEWNNVYGEKRFDVKIWKNKVYDGDAYHIEWGGHSPYSIKLPPGHYEAYVDAANELKCLMSNVVAFDVAVDKSQFYICSNVAATDTEYIVNSEINLLEQSAVYAAAVYTADSNLLDVKTLNLQRGAENASVNLTKYSDAAYVKVFLWDNLKNMCPLTEYEKIPLR